MNGIRLIDLGIRQHRDIMSRDPIRDAVRGLTALEMTFVNVSGLQWTAHSPYIGQITYADTIFPCFAFLSGMSPAPVRRNVGIVGIGIGLQTISAFANGRSTRIPGVLQRLGVASLLANSPYLDFLHVYEGLPLIALWYAITLLGSKSSNPLAHPGFPDADPSKTAQTRIDTLLFGSRIYRPSYDPEGLLGDLTTAVSMIVGRAFEQKRFFRSESIVEGLGMIAVGEALHYFLPKYAPISKSLWTPSFVLVSSGISILKYFAMDAAYPYLPEIVKSVLEAVGRRSLEVYVVSSLLTMLLKYGGERSLFSRGIRSMKKFIGEAGSDFLMSWSLTGVVAASAVSMVSHRVRLQW